MKLHKLKYYFYIIVLMSDFLHEEEKFKSIKVFFLLIFLMEPMHFFKNY